MARGGGGRRRGAAVHEREESRRWRHMVEWSAKRAEAGRRGAQAARLARAEVQLRLRVQLILADLEPCQQRALRRDGRRRSATAAAATGDSRRAEPTATKRRLRRRRGCYWAATRCKFWRRHHPAACAHRGAHRRCRRRGSGRGHCPVHFKQLMLAGHACHARLHLEHLLAQSRHDIVGRRRSSCLTAGDSDVPTRALDHDRARAKGVLDLDLR